MVKKIPKKNYTHTAMIKEIIELISEDIILLILCENT